ncbi:MAG: 23S rRNA (uracil(1939)-C(5))-methyltransferase RlmD [Clostridiales bacterium]|nr:23S rRNA (uracil(1939)-C(5))-methyltransferase RlmD [Clostridiales bacterium]
MQKNDLVTVTIEDMTTEGEGIGKADGFPLFIKDSIIGDQVRAKVMKLKKTYGYARVEEVLVPSDDRVQPACDVARQCGGCQLQAMSYEKQLEFKRNKVKNNLRRIGGFQDIEVLPVIGMEQPWRYRNKTQVPFGMDKNGEIVAGFYAGRTHSIINHEDCLLAPEINTTIIQTVKAYMKQCKVMPYDEKNHRGIIRHVLIRQGYKTGEIMVCVVINHKSLPGADVLVERLKQISGMTSISYNINCEKTNVILGEKVIHLYGPGYITDYIGDVKYQISPQSFFQVNPVQTEKLYAKALEYAQLTGNEIVWDLYCGIGTITLFLAQKAKMVYGVEIVPPAIEDAKKNAALNHIQNAQFYVGRAEDILPEKYKKEQVKADVIVVDPPRKGCDQELLQTIIQIQPKRVVYVSCDSATLARDLKYMNEQGYEIEKVQPVDMFAGSVHVETVVLLSQQKPDDTIEIDLDLDELDATAAETKATYEEIKAYVWDKYHLKVSSLYISQIKRKCGLEVGQNYNLSKSENPKVPKCPPEKEAAIMDALKHFQMI